MPYNITLTNGSLYATIPDGTLNTQSSMTLIGQNYVGGYGEFQNDNFIRLLENGSNVTAPSAPLVGQLWYNSQTKVLQVYNGTQFKPLGGANASPTAPLNNTVGDLWYDTVNNQLFAWTGADWNLIGPVGGEGTGAAPATIVDNTAITHEVVEIIINGNVVGIVSQDATFTPQANITGFSNILPGFNLATTVNSQSPRFVGTATNSQLLNGAPSTSYMSSVSNTATTGTLSVLNNTGLTVGTNGELVTSVQANTVSIRNTAINGDLDIGINKSGAQTPIIRINGASGNTTITGNLQVTGTTITVNQEIVNTSEVITGNVTAGNITSNAFITATSFVGTVANVTTVRGTVGNLTTINANTVNANTVNGNVIANTVSSTVFNTPSWTIREYGGVLYFQTSLGANVASLDSSGNFTTIGDITAFGTL